MSFQFSISLHTFYETTLEDFRNGNQTIEVDEIILKQIANGQQKEFAVGIQPMDLTDTTCLEDQLIACEKLLRHWDRNTSEEAETRILTIETSLASTGQSALENMLTMLEAYAETDIIEEDDSDELDEYSFDEAETLRLCHGTLDDTKPAEPALQILRNGIRTALQTGDWDRTESLQATALIFFGEVISEEHAESLRELLTETSDRYQAFCSSFRQIGRVPTEADFQAAIRVSQTKPQML